MSQNRESGIEGGEDGVPGDRDVSILSLACAAF